MTDRFHDAEQALQEERSIFLGGPVVVFKWRNAPGWPVEYVSPNVQNVFGYAPEALLSGQVAYASIVHCDDIERVTGEVIHFSEGGATNFSHAPYRIVKPDGSSAWVADHTTILRDATGAVTHYLGYLIDETARKAAEDERHELELQMQHVQRLESLGVLAGGLAHDFNNILLAILGNASIAINLVDSNSELARLLTPIIEASERAAALTRQMLNYAGKGRASRRPVDLSIAAKETMDLLQASLPKKARLHFELSPSLRPIAADPAQLDQVIMNLVINAAEALSEQSGDVWIRTGETDLECDDIHRTLLPESAEPGSFSFIEVKDNGEGMSREVRARLFEPFFSTKSNTGRGLGLAAVLGIIRAHHGTIELRTEPGQGSTFCVYLPQSERTSNLASSHPPEFASSASQARARQGTAAILFVDDEAAIRRLAHDALTDAGYDVTLAEDGEDALAKLEEGTPDIIVLDLTMPKHDGRDVLAELERLAHPARVIISSGFSEDGLTGLSNHPNFETFLQKPYRIEALTDAVRNAANRRWGNH